MLRLYIRRIKGVLLLIFSLLIRLFTHIKRKRIIMWSYYGKNYSCNPKAITEFLISQDSDYEIFWAFLPGKIPSDLPNDIKPVITAPR